MKTIYLCHRHIFQSAVSRPILLIVVFVFLLFNGSCVQTEIKENGSGEPCFTKESLETVHWIVDELKQFQVPKSGGYEVSVRIYHGQPFLVVANVFLSSPMGHIFNCEGVTISDLGIHYNEFYDNSELVAVLADVPNYY